MKQLLSLAVAMIVMIAAATESQAQVIFNSWEANTTGFFAFAPGTGSLGVEDYSTDPGGVNYYVDSLRFVGGVDTVGGIVDFNFFFSGGGFNDGFSVALPTAGNFIWTINFAPILIGPEGFMQIVLDPSRPENFGVSGQWFLTENGVSVGSSDGAPQLAQPFNFAFELNGEQVPEPTTAGIFALAGLGFVARRRRA